MRLYEVTFDKRLIVDGTKDEVLNKDLCIKSLLRVPDVTEVPGRYLKIISTRGYAPNNTRLSIAEYKIFIIDIDFGVNSLISHGDVYEFIFNMVMPIIRNENISRIIE